MLPCLVVNESQRFDHVQPHVQVKYVHVHEERLGNILREL